MKSIIKYSAVFIMFVITLLVTMDINSISQRKAELNDSLSTAERNVLKGSNINKMYDMSESDMKVELIRNIAENMNTDNDITVKIHDVNKAGLVDASVTAEFKHLNGKPDTRTVRKTVIVEEWNK